MLAYVVGRPSACFTTQNSLSCKNGHEYEHIGCNIDSLFFNTLF